MANDGAGGPGKRSVVVALLVTLAAPVMAYAAVRNAAMDLAGAVGDPTAALPPRSVWPPLKAIMRAARRPDQALPANAHSVAERAAMAAPLAFEPYYIAARVQEKAGRYRRATVLMEEARRRRPNATSVRVALLGYYSLASAYQQAIDEADFAMRINTASRGLILPGFAKLVAIDPKARAAIAVALAKEPPWRGPFLEEAARAKLPPDTAKALVAEIRKLHPASSPQAEEAFLIQSLVQAGDFRGARALWASYNGQVPAGPNTIVDPNFRGQGGLQPFAWTFYSGQEGTAEITKSGGAALLEVAYFGRAPTVLAEQTLSVRPGRYSLSTIVSGNSSAADVRLAWTMICLPSRRLLARLDLQPLGERSSRKQGAVVVPAGCEGQLLVLSGEPSDLARTLGAEITEVSLVPASGAEAKR